MMSIYQRALGSDFQKLDPRIRERFSLTPERSFAFRGTGVIETLWHGAAYTLPFLYIGTWRSVMFPESGRDVPFTIQNYAYLDTLGRETVTWVRTFRPVNNGGSTRTWSGAKSANASLTISEHISICPWTCCLSIPDAFFRLRERL